MATWKGWIATSTYQNYTALSWIRQQVSSVCHQILMPCVNEWKSMATHVSQTLAYILKSLAPVLQYL